jgi:hypothetical protein
VAHQANNSTVPLHKALGHTRSAITRAIVNKYDLIRSRKGGEGGERIGNKRLKVLSLVVAGEEE